MKELKESTPSSNFCNKPHQNSMSWDMYSKLSVGQNILVWVFIWFIMAKGNC